jgi:single-strand DNA-binding protein
MNNCTLIGRLTKDVEVKTLESGMVIGNFTIAVNRVGKKDESDFFDCICFKGTAEFASKYFSKGMRVAVNGAMQTRNWKDKEDKTHYKTELIVNNLEFADGKSEGNTSSPSTKKTAFKKDEEEFTL